MMAPEEEETVKVYKVKDSSVAEEEAFLRAAHETVIGANVTTPVVAPMAPPRKEGVGSVREDLLGVRTTGPGSSGDVAGILASLDALESAFTTFSRQLRAHLEGRK